MTLRRRTRKTKTDIDPMSSAVNMTDLMLVLAMGFLIFAVMATGIENITNSDMSPQEKQEAMQTATQTTELEDQTQDINENPESVTQSGSGYQEMGKVYKDPETGKMVMVSS
ncbi:DUF2149 domain-containing protein [Methanosphaera sp. WGK6]|uniref:DUF2149 domain-containing protein n=1 Tax=Methanosphaera sp. WGK6 TaxID=1561964 RepID=UPI00084CB271|nr:DUF2149 domain-containing protein [Methanosphaera sp. WGK6]OED30487.1 membrane protein [Methanosphaera sp. WGK6]